MRRLLEVGACALLFGSVSLLGTGSARAEHGRDFSARYEFGAATAVDAAHVAVPIVLQLNNHAGADLRDATLVWREPRRPAVPPPTGATPQTARPALPSEPLATGIHVAARQSLRVTVRLTVSRAEWRRWQHGEPPVLILEHAGTSGRGTRSTIELVPASGLGARR